MSETRKVFLTAEWLDLVMLNYEVDPGFLEKYVPNRHRVGFVPGETHVSLVGLSVLLQPNYLGLLPYHFIPILKR